MMEFAAQDEKNGPGQAQIPFPGRSILIGCRRHDGFWRPAQFPSCAPFRARKSAIHEAKAKFAANIRSGWDHEYTPESRNKAC
jgi:hypothetical protein